MAVPMKTTNGNRKLILDVDTGIDDALALAYLASFNNIEILGVIGTYGNVAADTAVYNTAYVLERLGFRNVPVLRGSTRPSWAASFIPDAGCAQFHGTDGLGGFGPAVGSPAVACVSDSGESDIQSTTNTVYVSTRILPPIRSHFRSRPAMALPTPLRYRKVCDSSSIWSVNTAATSR